MFIGRISALALYATAAVASAPTIAVADETGVSAWLPGTFWNLAAVPSQPGWSVATFYYYTSVSAGADVARAREIQIGELNPTLSVKLSAHLNSDANLQFLIPSYTFANPVLGGQLALSMTGLYGGVNTSLAGTLTGTLTTPAGSIPFTRSASISDSVDGFGDLYPQATLKWNQGVNNFMTYLWGDIPVGAYDSTRLSNIGIGHGASDGGFGYTYFDPAKGHEFSAVAGLTYNFMNPSTDYQSGVDFHLDRGASQFLSKQVFVGLVGYFYNEVGCDSGSGDRVGCFQSRVASFGPQIGYIFPVGGMQGYLSLKGYKEFDAQDRPEGWNAWLTFAISPAAPTH
jgi:hypothetical protein